MQESSEEVDGHKPSDLFIKSENFIRWKRLFFEIYFLVNRNETVPPLLLQEFFSHLHFKSEINHRSCLTKASRITQRVLKFFSTRGDYNSISPEYSLENLVANSTYLYLIAKHRNKTVYTTKDETIVFFYLTFAIAKSNLSSQHKGKLTHYKMAVLSAYLTQEVGFKLTTKPSPTTTDFHQASRNALKGIHY